MNEINEIYFKEAREYGNINLSVNYAIKIIGEKNLKNDISILDVGTNIGSLPYNLYKCGIKKVYGTDIRKDSIEHGKNKYREISNGLQVMKDDGILPYDSNTFDYVTAFDVIEHVPDVELFLKEIYRVLKPGGVFIFQTPNLYINSIWETIRWKSLTKWKAVHCSLQTYWSLNKILRDSGLHSIVIEKNSLISEFNENKLRKYIGPLAKLMLITVNKFPIGIFPNLWGSARK